MTHQTLIKGGTILSLDDHEQGRTADVLIVAAIIQAIEPAKDAANTNVIDPSGLIVMQGFVDWMHIGIPSGM